jgi:hypothetical protein
VLIVTALLAFALKRPIWKGNLTAEHYTNAWSMTLPWDPPKPADRQPAKVANLKTAQKDLERTRLPRSAIVRDLQTKCDP